MIALAQAVNEYLALRRALGYKLERQGSRAAQFVEFLEQHDATVITTELALAWAIQPADATRRWWHQRLTIVRGFARYLQAFDPRHEVPPATCCQPRTAARCRTCTPRRRSRR